MTIDLPPLNLADVPKLLQHISSNERKVWVQVAMGLKAEFGEDAFADWDTWSSTSESYSRLAALQAWRSLKKSGVGIGSVIALAVKGGWEPGKKELTPEEKKRLSAEHEARRKKRQAEIEADEARSAAMSEVVAIACQRIWNDHCKAAGESQYLINKGVGCYGARFINYAVLLSIDDERQRCDVWKGAEVKEFFNSLPKPRPDHISMLQFKKGSLVIPVIDASGKLHSLQVISATGTKLFPKYSRKSGCFFVLGELSGAATVAIAEGYATAASVHEATGWPVVVAFDCYNLLNVGGTIRERCPEARIVFTGDDNPGVEGNPGRTAANAAADAVNGIAVFPEFEEAA